jgi:tetratricopeptide (TPR) repeat protein
MKAILYSVFTIVVFTLLTGCGMDAKDYFVRGNEELTQYDCKCVQDYKVASEMELEDEGDWYPIYMLSLGLGRYYCDDFEGSMKAFQTVDQYIIKKSETSDLEKGYEFMLSKGNRMYELTEREETLLHYYMGMSNFKLQNYEDAMIEFKKVDYIAEGEYAALPLIALMRGLTYEKLGDKGNATVAYKKIMEENPESPLGYILTLRTEEVEGNRTYLLNKLQEKFNLKFENPTPDKQQVITLLECTGGIVNDYRFVIDYKSVQNNAYLFDRVDPEFNFDDFATGLIKEIGSAMTRNLAKYGLSVGIPIFGGIIGEVAFGGEEGESRSWSNIPEVFIADVVYLNQGEYDINIQYYDGDELIREKNEHLDTSKDIVFVTIF